MKPSDNDLLAVATSEMPGPDELPGLLLGLDGWVLRSIPTGLRKKFLEGYEKSLQIAFHPDRYPDPVTKLSRQRYLQAVSEAISYMTKDEFQFELCADAVPTKRNPFVALQHTVNIRDNIIEKLNEQVAELEKFRAEHLHENHSLKENLSTAMSRADRMETRFTYFHSVVSDTVKSFPVPIASKAHTVEGCFVNMQKLALEFDRAVVKAGVDGISQDPTLFSRLDTYTCKDHFCARSEWVTKKTYVQQFGKYASKPQTLSFKKYIDLENNFEIEGAMTVAHLCEYLRDCRRPVPGVAWMYEGLTHLLHPPDIKAKGYVNWWDRIREYTLPFYTPGCFLLIRDRTDSDQPTPWLRLFLVKKSDYEESPNEALVNGFKRQVVKLKQGIDQRVIKLRETAHWLRSKIAGLKHELKVSQAKVKLYEKWFVKQKLPIPLRPIKPVVPIPVPAEPIVLTPAAPPVESVVGE